MAEIGIFDLFAGLPDRRRKRAWGLPRFRSKLKARLANINNLLIININKPVQSDMTGQELHQILLNKWGCSYDIQIRRTKGRIFVQVMWKYLEQASFPLSEAEYLEHLDTVSSYLNAWEGVSQVREYIEKTRERPRLGKPVSIPLNLGERASEWILD